MGANLKLVTAILKLLTTILSAILICRLNTNYIRTTCARLIWRSDIDNSNRSGSGRRNSSIGFG